MEPPKSEPEARTPDPVTGPELPRIEPAVLSHPPKQNRKHYLLLAGLIILLGAIAAYAALKLGTAKP